MGCSIWAGRLLSVQRSVVRRRCSGGNFATGFSEFERLTAQGVDFRTAQEAGLVQGITAGAGTLIPMSLGLRAGGALAEGVAASLRGRVKVQCDAPQQQQYVQRQILPMPQVQILRSVWHSVGLLQNAS